MTPAQLEDGYWDAYREFYTWRNIARGAAGKPTWLGRGRHVAYAAGWKKFERLWDVIINARRLGGALPVLEGVLSGLGRVRPDSTDSTDSTDSADSPPAPVDVAVRRRPVAMLPTVCG
jgi:hypothetical protein